MGSAARLGLSATTNEHPVPVKVPRATSGDPIEPEWRESLTLTVGPQKADLVGTTEKVIQAAVDSRVPITSATRSTCKTRFGFSVAGSTR
jgi:hypothetical protein